MEIFHETVETKQALASLELAHQDEFRQGLKDLETQLQKEMKGSQNTAEGSLLDEELSQPEGLGKTGH